MTGRYLALNPMHAVPTLCDDQGKGVWESGVVLRKLASYAGEEPNDKQAIAMDFRQTTMYKVRSRLATRDPRPMPPIPPPRRRGQPSHRRIRWRIHRSGPHVSSLRRVAYSSAR